MLIKGSLMYPYCKVLLIQNWVGANCSLGAACSMGANFSMEAKCLQDSGVRLQQQVSRGKTNGV